MQQEKLGASCFGPGEIYKRLKSFKRRVMREGGKMPKLYFVKVDVQACFDTIEQGKLLDIILKIISEVSSLAVLLKGRVIHLHTRIHT